MHQLFLIPTTLDNAITGNVLLPSQLKLILSVQYFIVENAKIGRAHLKQLNLPTPIQQLNIQELNKHNTNYALLIKPLLDGHDLGLISDCGLPAIADPGNEIVKLAHKHNIKVTPLVGPSSIFLALMASGVSGQNFAFNGYLPVDKELKVKAIQQLQWQVNHCNQSQIFIETPYRNQGLFELLLTTLNPDITLCLAINLMQENQSIKSQTIKQWHKLKANLCLNKEEVVFVIGK
ncbi:MAG: SAM-dependent methyltransferase [Burkholderiales bacterium]|jgi:16S rRNA (cytidine1402-2'-O)-methyltransferase|nr:SAM-dependent methyltransferase [Burkholderiales bacterium]